MTIRLAQPGDLPRILELYAQARRFMAENGNPTQWNSGYPQVELLEDDIRQEQLYVVSDAQCIQGVFVFVLGEDPTYGYIEDGAWRSSAPYGTIHRIAGSGGIFAAALEFSRRMCPHIRMDTHRDNAPMLHLAQKHGFRPCGTIYVKDGTPRVAFELLDNE